MEILYNNDHIKGLNILATIGMFDGVHLGHRFLINNVVQSARQVGTKSAIITFKDHPQRVFNPSSDLRMITTIDERLKRIAELGVDFAIVLDFTQEFSKISSAEFMRMLKQQFSISTLIMGFNHRFGCNKDEDFDDYIEHGKNLGIAVKRAEEYRGEYSPVSSSLVRKMIEEGRVDLAKLYLTRPFELSGTVVHGKQNGRKIGFPTANIDVPPYIIIPHRGVYTVTATLENGESYGGMANIGVRPTIEKGGSRTIEVNIFDFDDDIYGQTLNVQFMKFMRSEMKMGSLEELKNKLALDKLACIDTLKNQKS